jgi:MFS family permease
MNTEQVAAYMATTVMAGLLAQWPMGKLSDRIRRSRLIRTNSAILGFLVLAIALLPLSGYLQLAATFCFGVLAFTLYPLGTAMANQNIEQHERVALSATILLTFGIGASTGPLLASVCMQFGGSRMLYGFMAAVAAILFVRLQQVNYQQKLQERAASQDYVMASGDLVSSPLAAALDPRVDQQTAQAQLSSNGAAASVTMPTPEEKDGQEEMATQQANPQDPIASDRAVATNQELQVNEHVANHQQTDEVADEGSYQNANSVVGQDTTESSNTDLSTSDGKERVN